jgi:hypothetical protein
MFEFEEYKKIRQIYGWLIIIALSLLLISWCMIAHMLIPETERQWDFGVIDDTPASSKYSTVPTPEDKNVPLQIKADILEQKKFKE